MSRRLSSWPVARSVNGLSVVVASPFVVLRGLLVVDFTRYLPGPFASRELLRLGARVVRVEAPEGDPLRAVAPGLGRRAERGQGIGRLGPRTRSDPRPGAGCAGRRRARRLPSRRRRTARPRRGRATRVDRVLLDHRLRRRRYARRTRSQLPGLGRLARRHGAGAAARADRGPCRWLAVRRDRHPRSAARPRPQRGSWRAAHGVDDAQRPQARVAPATRRAGARADRQPRLLPDLRDQRPPPAHRDTGRAEVLAAAVRVDRPLRPRRAAVRRRPGVARGRARERVRLAAARRVARAFRGRGRDGRARRDARGGGGVARRDGIGGQGAGSRRAHRSVARSSSHPFEGWAPPQAEDDSRGG